LLQTDEGWNGSTALRSTAYRYRQPAGSAYPEPVGVSPQSPYNGEYLTGRHRPQDQRVITQQGAAFTWQADSFDAFARPVSVTRSSSLGHRRSETTTYHDHAGKWVLGQVASITEGSTGLAMESHSYDASSALRSASYRFGRLLGQYTYNADGTLYASYDPLNRGTFFSNYKRGLAQNVSYPDGSSESAVVNDLGQITALTNAAGSTTGYGYDAMGRLARITPPGGDAVGYHPTTQVFEPVAAAEYGLAAGHWRHTVATGNGRTVRYYDGLWRPLLTRTWDAADEAGTRRMVQARYDAEGRKTFESQPQRAIGAVDAAVAGTGWTHDALGRVTRQVQDSELGPLTTGTDYLDGFIRRVTNPRGQASSYAYQAFDTPSEDALATVWAPEGLTVGIARDVFGKPQAITRSGSYAGSALSATRSYVYDAHQRLCKTVEPESGATVQAYDGAGNVAWRASGLSLPGGGCDQGSVPDGRKISHGYDAMGRLTSTSYVRRQPRHHTRLHAGRVAGAGQFGRQHLDLRLQPAAPEGAGEPGLRRHGLHV
jgi:YD repeat-containing protein